MTIHLCPQDLMGNIFGRDDHAQSPTATGYYSFNRSSSPTVFRSAIKVLATNGRTATANEGSHGGPSGIDSETGTGEEGTLIPSLYGLVLILMLDPSILFGFH